MTHRMVETIAAGISECSSEKVDIKYCDICRAGSDDTAIELDDETIAVVGMPAYVGKLPLPGVRIINNIAGSGAMTIAAVSYGGRSYGNSLYELQHVLEECDFKVIGAGAFMISYMASRGSSRSAGPTMDVTSLSEFSKAATAKIARLAGCEIEGLKIKPAPIEVKGRMPVHMISKFSPKAAAIAQEMLEKMSFTRNSSEWFL